MKSLGGMDVIVLAGGLGTRLRSVLADRPKILAPVHGRPFLDYLIKDLANRGAGRVILSLGFQADLVEEHLASSRQPLPVVTVIEPEPLGTAGALRLACASVATDPVLVINGDTWLETDYAAFVEDYTANASSCSILCVRLEDTSRYGSLELTANGTVTRFVEKAETGQRAGLISGGVYLFGKKALEALALTKGPSLERDFLETRRSGELHGFIADRASFIDIGTPESLREAESFLPRQL